jgi:hypothetical protein
MKKIILFAVIAFSGLSLSSCSKVDGKGDVVSQERAVSGFTGISLSMDATVNYSTGTSDICTVSAQDNLQSIIETNVENGVLVIKVQNNKKLGSHQPITINITAANVKSLDISSSGTINGLTPWTPQNSSLNISGSGSISMPYISTSSLSANISGSGSITVTSGTAVTEQLTISGSGNINVQGVVADNVTANISGSGGITLFAALTLDATISGSGNIKYLGNPVITTHISGSGNVIPL